MTGEPSVKRYKKCLSGHQTVEGVPVLNININIIKEDGFKALESSLLLPLHMDFPTVITLKNERFR